jgi:hypothetical protein
MTALNHVRVARPEPGKLGASQIPTPTSQGEIFKGKSRQIPDKSPTSTGKKCSQIP